MSDLMMADVRLETISETEQQRVQGGVLPLAVHLLIYGTSLVVDWVIADYLADGHIGE